MTSRRSRSARSAYGVAGAEEPVDRHHAVVAPLIFRGGVAFRPARPSAGARSVRAHDVGLGRGQLGVDVLGVDVLRRLAWLWSISRWVTMIRLYLSPWIMICHLPSRW